MRQKKKKGCWFFVVYLRFLSTSAAAMTAMMTTAAAIAMYVDVGIPLVGCGATLGEAVTDADAAGPTLIAVSADDAEYELDPANVAVIVYLL